MFNKKRNIIFSNKKSLIIITSILLLALIIWNFIHPLLSSILLISSMIYLYNFFNSKIKYVLKRMGLMLITLSIILTITFFLVFLMPGDLIPNADKMSKEVYEGLVHQYGFDRPIIIQFFDYLKNLLIDGNFGISLYDKTPVLDKISRAVPISASIGIIAVSLGAVIGISLGLVSALKKNTWIDYVATFIAVLGISIPSFVLATLNREIFAVNLGLLPATYNGSPGPLALILPIFSLSIFTIAAMARYTRTEMLETLNSNYIVLARAKGVKIKSVIYKHAFRNALIPIITVLGPQIVAILTGSLVIERIFAIPGLGDVLTNAVLSKDVFLIVGTNIFLSILFLTTYLIVDVLYSFIDPRINLEGGE